MLRAGRTPRPKSMIAAPSSATARKGSFRGVGRSAPEVRMPCGSEARGGWNATSLALAVRDVFAWRCCVGDDDGRRACGRVWWAVGDAFPAGACACEGGGGACGVGGGG